MMRTWCGLLLLAVVAVGLFGAYPQKLVPSEFIVDPGLVRWWKFDVPDSARVSGKFHVYSGGQRDIEAIVATWDECENWINGNQAHAVWQSGRVTNGKVNVPLNGSFSGTYCIAFSNRMSVVTAKEVSAEITIERPGW